MTHTVYSGMLSMEKYRSKLRCLGDMLIPASHEIVVKFNVDSIVHLLTVGAVNIWHVYRLVIMACN